MEISDLRLREISRHLSLIVNDSHSNVIKLGINEELFYQLLKNKVADVNFYYEIVKKNGFKDRTARKWLKQLESKEVIFRKKQGYKGNWLIYFHPEFRRLISYLIKLI